MFVGSGSNLAGRMFTCAAVALLSFIRPGALLRLDRRFGALLTFDRLFNRCPTFRWRFATRLRHIRLRDAHLAVVDLYGADLASIRLGGGDARTKQGSNN